MSPVDGMELLKVDELLIMAKRALEFYNALPSSAAHRCGHSCATRSAAT